MPGPIGWQLFTFERLLGEAEQRARELRPGQPLSPADAQFFMQFLAISRSATAILEDPSAYHNPWRSLVSVPTGQQDLLAEPQRDAVVVVIEEAPA